MAGGETANLAVNLCISYGNCAEKSLSQFNKTFCTPGTGYMKRE